MRHPSIGRVRRLAILAGAMTLASAGCSSDAKSPQALTNKPAAGQAGVWLRLPGNYDQNSMFGVVGGPSTTAASAGADGSVYVIDVCGHGARIDSSRAIHAFGPLERGGCAASYGLVAMSDGSALFSNNGVLKRIDSANNITDIAGSPDANPPGSGTVSPETSNAATVRFGRNVAPIGRRPDGSVILMDHDAVWSLKGGRLTRLFACGGSSGTHCADPSVDSAGAVDASGNTYLVYSSNGVMEQGGLVVIAPDGTTHPVQLSGDAANKFVVLSMSSDGAGGAYIEGYTATSGRPGAKLLHLVNDHFTTVLTEQYKQADCPATVPVDAVPCHLPGRVVGLPGDMALLVGDEPYALAVGVAA
jgi:hypothetical protein